VRLNNLLTGIFFIMCKTLKVEELQMLTSSESVFKIKFSDLYKISKNLYLKI